MSIRTTHILVTLLTGLLMATAFGHLLEMPMKMRASAELWLTYQHTLYAWFAIVGGPIEILAILASWYLTHRLHRAGEHFKPAMAVALILTFTFFAIWVGLINPVNQKTAVWSVATIPADWQHWRAQWEYSHAVRFVLQFAALTVLLLSAIKKDCAFRE